jgi:phospholipid/cholesterol/gamma-HCH transport system substrate-binding protein
MTTTFPGVRARRLSPEVVKLAWRVSRPKVLGLGFLLVVGALVALSIAIYTKAFTTVTEVTLRADRTGNQLNQNADVKVRGVIVGEVRQVHSRPDGADLTLALQPGKTNLIPSDVQARILPKTLFGEKFVELVVPPGSLPATGTSFPVGQRIRAGDVISQDRSATAIELGTVFDDLLPLLRAVDPAALNSALNSVATALDGRGAELGDNFARFRDLLVKFNPSVPMLEADLSALADVADTFNAAAPELLRTLSNQSSISNTLVAKRDPLARVLTTNESQLVRLADVSKPILQVVRDNGQSIPYIFSGITALAPRIDAALGGNGPFLHITAALAPIRRAYLPGVDCPTYGVDKGPNCPGGGTNGIGAASSVEAANGRKPGDPGAPGGAGSAATASYGQDYVDARASRGEARQIAAIVGAANGQDPTGIEALSDVLFGPLLRGTEVTLS